MFHVPSPPPYLCVQLLEDAHREIGRVIERVVEIRRQLLLGDAGDLSLQTPETRHAAQLRLIPHEDALAHVVVRVREAAVLYVGDGHAVDHVLLIVLPRGDHAGKAHHFGELIQARPTEIGAAVDRTGLSGGGVAVGDADPLRIDLFSGEKLQDHGGELLRVEGIIIVLLRHCLLRRVRLAAGDLSRGLSGVPGVLCQHGNTQCGGHGLDQYQNEKSFLHNEPPRPT